MSMPDTSKFAHDNKSDESKQRDYERILVALDKIGEGNYEEIAKAMNEKELNVVSRRMKEMRDRGEIENTGTKTKTSRGCWAFVHRRCKKEVQHELFNYETQSR